jgi:hypothetical protein
MTQRTVRFGKKTPAPEPGAGRGHTNGESGGQYPSAQCRSTGCRVCRVNVHEDTRAHGAHGRTSQPSQRTNAPTPHDRATTESAADSTAAAPGSQPLLAADSEDERPPPTNPTLPPGPFPERLPAPAQNKAVGEMKARAAQCTRVSAGGGGCGRSPRRPPVPPRMSSRDRRVTERRGSRARFGILIIETSGGLLTSVDGRRSRPRRNLSTVTYYCLITYIETSERSSHKVMAAVSTDRYTKQPCGANHTSRHQHTRTPGSHLVATSSFEFGIEARERVRVEALALARGSHRLLIRGNSPSDERLMLARLRLAADRVDIREFAPSLRRRLE